MPINAGTKRKDIPKIGAHDMQPAIAVPDSLENTPYDYTDVFGMLDGKRLLPNEWNSKNRVFEFEVKEEFDNCLLCEYRGSEHYVAKPRALRRNTYDTGEAIDGVLYTYQDVNERLAQDAVGTEDDETQLITPNYYDGLIINVMAGSLVTDVDGDPLKDEDDHDMYLVDVTVGRCWAVEA